MTDAQLLQDFITRQDQAAFEEIVRRHGAMVLRTCQRLLQNGPDADDAFQAVFIVLARRASDVKGELLGCWLHGVAQRVAIRARTRTWRQQSQEKPIEKAPEPSSRREPPREASSREMIAVVDEELQQLPNKYRAAVVLCCLEGKTTDQAAQEIGCTRGTLVGNLTRGRDCLRERLARRGVMVTGAVLAAGLATEAASASVPAGLTASAAKGAAGAAASLKAGAMADALVHSLVWAKVKLYGLILACATVVTVVPAYILLLPAEGLVLHFACTEGSGTQIRDDSSTGNNGSVNGGVTWVAGPKPGSKALSFDGKSGYIKLDKNVAPYLGKTATLACWISTTQLGNSDTSSPAIVGTDAVDDDDAIWGWLDASGRIGVGAGAGPQEHKGTTSAQSKQPINDGRWHHVAMTRNLATGEVQIFINGVFQARALSGLGIKSAPLTDIGRFESKHNQAAYFFRGALGEFRLYSRVLTAEEIRRLAQ